MSTEQLSGDVVITLNGEEHVLRPSLQAATTLSNTFAGLSNAFTGLTDRNLSTYQAIVKAGIVTAERISTKDLNNYVWQAGMVSLMPSLIDFLSILNNGGRKPGEADDKAKDGDDDQGNGHHHRG